MYLSRSDGFGEALRRKAAAGLIRNCLMKDFVRKRNSSDRLVMVGLSGMLESLSQAPLLLSLGYKLFLLLVVLANLEEQCFGFFSPCFNKVVFSWIAKGGTSKKAPFLQDRKMVSHWAVLYANIYIATLSASCNVCCTCTIKSCLFGGWMEEDQWDRDAASILLVSLGLVLIFSLQELTCPFCTRVQCLLLWCLFVLGKHLHTLSREENFALWALRTEELPGKWQRERRWKDCMSQEGGGQESVGSWWLQTRTHTHPATTQQWGPEQHIVILAEAPWGKKGSGQFLGTSSLFLVAQEVPPTTPKLRETLAYVEKLLWGTCSAFQHNRKIKPSGL